MDTRKAHPHPLCTYIRAVAKQACITYTRKGYAYIGVSQIPRGVMHQFSWRLFGCKPHQNLRYLILNPQCPAKQLFTSSFRHYDMDNNHYAIAKVQKVFGFTSGKGEKFGLGQEKSSNCGEFAIYKIVID